MNTSWLCKIATKTYKMGLVSSLCLLGLPKQTLAQRSLPQSGISTGQGQAINPFKGAHRFAAATSLPGTSDDYMYRNGLWGLETQSTYRYNAAGQQVSRTSKSVLTGQFQDKDSARFDGKGNMTFTGSYFWFNNSWHELSGLRINRTYNGSNQPTEIQNQLLKQGVWTNATKQTLSYNASGNLTDETSYSWDAGNWEPYKREIYVYGTAAGQPTEIVFQEYINGLWENIERFANITWYNFSTRQYSGYEGQMWTGNAWTPMTKSTTVYNALGGYETLVQIAGPAQTWINSKRTIFSYDSRLNFTGTKTELWQASTWVLDSDYQEVLAYNSTDDVVERVMLHWDKPTNAYQYFMRRVYSNFSRISGTNAGLTPLQVTLYPNPTSGFLHIQTEKQALATLSLTDLSGRMVLQQKLEAIVNKVDISALAKGVYLVHLQQANGTYTSKIVKE